MGVIQQFGYAQQRKLASEELADAGLRYIQHFFQLPGRDFLLLDQLENVLMKVSLQLKLQTVLCSEIQLIKDASLRPVRLQCAFFVLQFARPVVGVPEAVLAALSQCLYPAAQFSLFVSQNSAAHRQRS